ncbi:serine/threonine-protein kinase [Corynebacterium pyruviciproducens]|uniref:serine/threonine-protein kinase n=1 Tax=Corynebacterium pyruviciproducens TaxID=598660 RepID=UPI00254F1636|nr:serine/threonine-protein kinase [Corynebacterium pyruviciproducens]MDK7214222.1 protein kinase [Corynebacterium pyruviciproducens]
MDNYQLIDVIGHGGMSTVWLARDRRGREVAVKKLKPELTGNAEFVQRFQNEARAAMQVNNPNVVQTYDFTDDAIVMEYVRGESLADLLAREASLPEDVALDVLEQAAHGLASIHRAGMIHRDIKPGNLLITEQGQVKITDFGIAKAASAVPLTQTGMVVGTAQYVSPEQAQGNPLGPASDVYSLGVVGYEMLTGHRPFVGDSSVSVAIAHINQAPPAMPPSISPQVRELIGICLRKDPSARFRDGATLAGAVSQVRGGQRPAGAPPTTVAPAVTQTTRALGREVRPTTVPKDSTRVDNAPTRKKSGGGTGWLVFIALLLVAGIGAFMYYFLGVQDSTPDTTQVTTTSEVIVTQTVAPRPVEPAQPTTTSAQPSSTSPTTRTTAAPSEPTTSAGRPSSVTQTSAPTSKMPIPEVPLPTDFLELGEP